MDVDTGNLSAVAKVTSKDGGPDVEVDLEKAEAGIGEKHAPISATETEEDEEAGNKLPFSKARSISFVLALTGAAFLNVQFPSPDSIHTLLS